MRRCHTNNFLCLQLKVKQRNTPSKAAEKINSTFLPPNQVETDDGRKYQQHRCHVEDDQNSTLQNIKKLECGPMPNVMVALLNIGGALCSTLQSLAHAHYLTAMQ